MVWPGNSLRRNCSPVRWVLTQSKTHFGRLKRAEELPAFLDADEGHSADIDDEDETGLSIPSLQAAE